MGVLPSILDNQNLSELSVAQKIKIIRKSLGIQQSVFADAALTSQARISRVENDEDEYNQEELNAIKERLGIKDMPLREFDRIAFRGSLYFWRDLLRGRKMDEAKALREKSSPILILEPLDPDLVMLFRLFEVLHLIIEDDMDTAKENLNLIYENYAHMNVEHFYYYYNNTASIYAKEGSYKNAIKYYTKSLDLIKNNKDFLPTDQGWLYYNLANCYSRLQMPHRTLAFLHKIPKAILEDKTTPHGLGVDIMFAINYIRIGEYRSAEALLNDCLMQAKATYNNWAIGVTLRNLGILNKRKENWEKAIAYFEQAMEVFGENSDHYSVDLYHKIFSLIGSREFVEAGNLLKKIKSVYDESHRDFVFFETLRHILIISKRISIYNKKSVEYIETISIPHFIENSANFEAIDCCRLIELHCLKTKKQIKSLEAKAIISDIYEKMFVSQMEGDVL